MSTAYLETYIRDIPDFPKPGIIFKDISPLLRDAKAFRTFLEMLQAAFQGEEIDVVVGVDARGFIFGGALAQMLQVGFVPIRKQGKLPSDCVSKSYELEYGTATIEMHRDALRAGERVLVVDDLLATGGTVCAAVSLCQSLGAHVAGCAFLMELGFLQGRARLADYGDFPVFAPILV